MWKKLSVVLLYLPSLILMALGVTAGYFTNRDIEHDKSLEQNRTAKITEVFHDQGDIFMEPLEPSSSEAVTLRIRTSRFNVTNAQIQYTTDRGQSWQTVEMTYEKRDKTGYFDYWTGQIPPQSAPYYYRFVCGNDDPGNVVYVTQSGSSIVEDSFSKSFYVMPDFKTPDWSKGALWYSVMPDAFYNGDTTNDRLGAGVDRELSWGALSPELDHRYGGDLKGITQKIADYIQANIQADALYMNPIWKTNQQAGYGGLDYNQIEGALGNEQDLIDLIACAHDNGMKVMLDAVLNYVDKNGNWMNESKLFPLEGAAQSIDSLFARYFRFYKWPDIYRIDWNNPGLDFANKETQEMAYTTPESFLTRYLAAPYNADGWRFDVGFEIWGTDRTAAEILKEIRPYIKSVNPEALFLSENGYGEMMTDYTLDARWNFDLMHTIRSWINGLTMQDGLANALSENTAELPRPVALSSHIYYENHDFLRLYGNTQPNKHMVEAGQLLIMTYLGSPCVYYGSETGLLSSHAFSSFDWDESAWDYDFLQRQRALGALRKEYSAVRTGVIKHIKVDNTQEIFSYGRWDQKGTVVTVLNQKNATQQVELDVRQCSVADGDVLTDYLTGKQYTVHEGKITVSVMPGGTVLVSGKAGQYRAKYQLSDMKKGATVVQTDVQDFLLSGKGSFGGSGDNMAYAGTPLFGNTAISAQIDESSEGETMLGLRADLTKKSASYGVKVRKNGTVDVIFRSGEGEKAITLTTVSAGPGARIKVTREDGNVFRTYIWNSTAENWELVEGSEVTGNLPYALTGGFAPLQGTVLLRYVEAGNTQPALYDDFDSESVSAMFQEEGNVQKAVLEEGMLKLFTDGHFGALTAEVPHGDWTAKAVVSGNISLGEGQAAGVSAVQSVTDFVSAGRTTLDGKPVLYLGKSSDGVTVVAQSVEDPAPNKPVTVQLQRVGGKYSAVYTVDGKTWAPIGSGFVYANYSDVRAGVFTTGSETVAFDSFCFGDSLADGKSTNTPRGTGHLNTSFQDTEHALVQTNMTIASGIWEYCLGGIAQTGTEEEARLDFEGKSFSDFRADATVHLTAGTGSAGYQFRASENSGYRLLRTAENKLELYCDDRLIGSCDLTDEQADSGRLVLECREDQIVVYAGPPATPGLQVRDDTYAEGKFSFFTRDASAKFCNYNLYDFQTVWSVHTGSFEAAENGVSVNSKEKWGTYYPGYISLNGVGVTDFLLSTRLEVTAMSSAGEALAGVAVNIADGQNPCDSGLSFVFSKTGEFSIRQDGTVLQSVPVEGAPDYINLILVSQNGHYSVYVDNGEEPLLEYTADTICGGAPVLFSNYANAGFYDLYLYGLQPDEDYTQLDVFQARLEGVNHSALATEPYAENFDDSSAALDRLRIYDGNWTVSDGSLVCTEATGWTSGVTLDVGKFRDFELTCRVKVASDNWMAVEFRKETPVTTHEQNAYSLMLFGTGQAAFHKDLVPVTGDGMIPGFAKDTWINIRLVVKGDTMEAYAGDTLILRATDTRFGQGYISLNSGNSAGAFDDVVVTPL